MPRSMYSKSLGAMMLLAYSERDFVFSISTVSTMDQEELIAQGPKALRVVQMQDYPETIDSLYM